MLLIGDEWIIQSTKDKGDPTRALVRMSCASHCFPELRTDGNNGIIQYNEFMGRFTPVLLKNRSHIGIVTETELGGVRASEMFKIAELGIRESSDPSRSSLSEVDRSSLMSRRSSLSIRGIMGDGRNDSETQGVSMTSPGGSGATTQTSSAQSSIGKMQRRNTMF